MMKAKPEKPGTAVTPVSTLAKLPLNPCSQGRAYGGAAGDVSRRSGLVKLCAT